MNRPETADDGRLQPIVPFEVVEVDSTLLDIPLVDGETGGSPGRPWLIIAMDASTRMVVGYDVSFTRPSEATVGRCVAQAILPKDEVMNSHGVDGEWPVWGFMKRIRLDNGDIIGTDNLRVTCEAYGIGLELRRPNSLPSAAIVERLAREITDAARNIPLPDRAEAGPRSTSNTEDCAVLTLRGFEAWLLNFITKVYHNETQPRLGMSPLEKWEIGVFGDRTVAGVGVQLRPENPETISADFSRS